MNKKRQFVVGTVASVLIVFVVVGIMARNGWLPAIDPASDKRTGWFGAQIPKIASSSWNPMAPPMMPSADQAALGALRLNPKNATGGTNLYSQNFAWGTSLVGLPGRAGLNAGLGISYNSLVWIKDTTNSEMIFDPDLSNVAPGFTIGFPDIERVYYDSAKSVYVFLMNNADGSRTEFRQIGSTVYFEAGDSSYRGFKMNSGAVSSRAQNIDITVTSTDGTMMHYIWKSAISRYACVEIKDRNGNLITIDYNSSGRMTAVTDTLGRVINVNYDTYGYPSTITQTWKDTNGSGIDTTHTWATLSYTTATVSTSFSSLTVVGPANSSTVKVLDKITYPDGSFTKFEYNGYIQVKKISNVAADSTSHVLNYVSTNLDSISGSQTDCPRLRETRSWVENFNLNGSGVPQEVVATNSLTTGATYSLPNSITGSATRIDVAMTGHPDGLYTRTYVGASGYKEGLPLATEDCTGTDCATRLRWTWTDWTQDNTSASYITNPRVVESRVGDGTNTKRTTVDYGSNGYGLPEKVKVYDTDLATVRKTQVSSYLLTSIYTDRRIIGLPSESKLYEGTDTSGTLMSKVTYAYDEGNMTGTDPVQNISPTQHDNTNYSSSFVTGRGLLTSTTRWDATAPTTSGSAVTSSVKYNTAGSVVAQTSPWYGTTTRTVKIGYADNFNSTVSNATYAYPTVLTDAAGSSLGDASHSSTVKYRYDIGANIEATSPAPAGQTYGKTSKREFSDTYGRLDKVSVLVNTTLKVYTRYEYPTNGVESKTFSTIIDTVGSTSGPDTADEVLSESWTDGAGRVRGSRTEHPGSTGGWTATQTEYDILGRVYRSSVPTEVSVASPYDPSHWTAAGDDATRGWIWNYQYYDWKGRTTRTVPSDSTGSDGKDTLISYAGCGCAGGMVTTIEGPSVPRDDYPTTNARRKQKVYADILGRDYKTEVYQWDGSTVYATAVRTFNGRDQVTNTRQYSGTTSSSTYQDTTATFDGHGRPSTRHNPSEDPSAVTTIYYNADDSVSQVVDPRGATVDLTYNSRGLTTGIAYAPPSTQPSYTTIADTPDVSFTYDNVGNRTAMSDGSGSTAYVYNELSQLTSETKTFSGLSGNFALTYAYQISGKLKSITDPFGAVVNYNDDKAGRTTSITGSNFLSVGTYASNIKYRAFGGVKELDYGSGDSSHIAYGFDNSLRVSTYEASSSVLTGGYVRKASYEYFADGNAKKVSNLLDPGFDQNYGYDSLGRMTTSASGTKTNGLNQTVTPFAQSIEYNAFGDMTSRSTDVWGSDGGFTASYTNSRKTGGTEIYDAAGHMVDKSTSSTTYDRWKFDASGRNVETVMRWFQTAPSPGIDRTETITKTFDGDGLDTKRVDSKVAVFNGTTTTTDTTEYYVNSSVLGGRRVTEIDGAGAKKQTNVILNNGVLAEQIVTSTTSEVYWRHDDPVSASYTKIDHSGNEGTAIDPPSKIEFDPLGGSIPKSDPNADPTLALPSSSRSFKYFGDVNRPEEGCMIDWMPAYCSDTHETAHAGAGEYYSGPHFKHFDDGHGGGGFREFQVRGDGRSGYRVPEWGSTTVNILGEDPPQRTPEIIGWKFVDVGLSSGVIVADQGPCERMAVRAGKIVTQLIRDQINSPGNNGHPDFTTVLAGFDEQFSLYYVGAQVKTLDNIKEFLTANINASSYVEFSKVNIKKVANGKDLGQGDFRSDLRDSIEKYDAADQTHHFTAFLSAGINMSAATDLFSSLHDVFDDSFKGNGGDLRLSRKAYDYGVYLRKDPGGLVGGVEAWIRSNICN